MTIVRKYRICSCCNHKKRTSVRKKEFICKPCRGFRRRIINNVSGTENIPDFKHTLNEKDVAILLSIFNGPLGCRKIAKETEIPISTLYKRLSLLDTGGFIKKLDLLYSLTNKSKNQITNLKGWDLNWVFERKNNPTKCLRFHALQGKFIVANPPTNYKNYLNKYLKIPVGRNKKETGFKLTINYCHIIFYNPTSISVTFPDVLVDDLGINHVAEGYSKLGEMIDALAAKLESIFPGLKIDSFCPFQLDNQHIAIKDSVYAKKYYERNGGYSNENDIITDKSHGHHELEAINPLTAGEDIEECLRREKESEMKLNKQCKNNDVNSK